VWAGVIFGLSHIPYLKSPFRMDWVLRKTCHVLEYAIFSALLSRAWKGSGWERAHLALAFLSSFLFALTDEWHQNFIPGRWGTWRDVRFDTLGTAAGIVLYVLGGRFRDRGEGNGKAAGAALPCR